MNRIGIFGAVQTVERRAARVRMCCRCAVNGAFKSGDEGFDRSRIGSRKAWRGHHPGAELENHFLPLFGTVANGAGGKSLLKLRQRQTTGLQFVVMTSGAVFIDDGL